MKEALTDSELAGISVSRIEVALFARQLATMLEAAVPLAQALEVLRGSVESEEMGLVLAMLLNHIEAGSSLSSAASRFPRVFPQVFRSMVRVGEETGNLTGVLQSAASWMEADQRVYARIKSALTYPAFVASTAAVLTLALFTTVVPGLLNVLVETNVKIPFVTQMVMAITRVLSNPLCYLMPAGLFGILWANHHRVAADRRLMSQIWNILISVPGLGTFLRSSALSRYVYACQILMETGIMPTRAVDLAAEATGSALFEVDRDRVLSELADGRQLSEILGERSELYDVRVIAFLQAGEASAQIPEMLGRAATILEAEMEMTVERLSSLLEPLLLFFIGALVATILVAIFLPLYASIQGI